MIPQFQNNLISIKISISEKYILLLLCLQISKSYFLLIVITLVNVGEILHLILMSTISNSHLGLLILLITISLSSFTFYTNSSNLAFSHSLVIIHLWNLFLLYWLVWLSQKINKNHKICSKPIFLNIKKSGRSVLVQRKIPHFHAKKKNPSSTKSILVIL